MWINSPVLREGAIVPGIYTCEGENSSPPLIWGDVPECTLSLAIICKDPDAPTGTFYHWAAYDISPSTRELDAGATLSATFPQGVNDFGKSGYGGPCPPRGSPPHHYHFDLYALPIKTLGKGANTSCRSIEEAVTHHSIDCARLTVRFAR